MYYLNDFLLGKSHVMINNDYVNIRDMKDMERVLVRRLESKSSKIDIDSIKKDKIEAIRKLRRLIKNNPHKAKKLQKINKRLKKLFGSI